METQEFEPVYQAVALEANRIAELLEEHGIEYHVTEQVQDTLAGTFGYGDGQSSLIFSVPVADAGRVKALLNASEAGDGPAHVAPPAEEARSIEAEPAAAKPFAPESAGFAVLYVATLGLWSFYWMFTNWKVVRQETGSFWSAPIAALLQHLFFWQLADHYFEKTYKDRARTLDSPLVLGALYFAGPFYWLMPVDYGWVLTLLHGIPLLRGNALIREATVERDEPAGRIARRNSLLNALTGLYVAMIFALFLQRLL